MPSGAAKRSTYLANEQNSEEYLWQKISRCHKCWLSSDAGLLGSRSILLFYKQRLVATSKDQANNVNTALQSKVWPDMQSAFAALQTMQNSVLQLCPAACRAQPYV